MAKQTRRKKAGATRHSAAPRSRTSRQAQRGSAEPLFDHAQGAMRSVLQVQDNFVRSWGDLIQQSSNLLEGQQRWKEAMLASVPALQRGIRAYTDALDRTSGVGLDWVRTALDSQAPAGILLQISKLTHELAQRSVNAMQANAQSMADANRLGWELWTTAMSNSMEAGRVAARSAEQVGRASAETARRTARRSARKVADLAASSVETVEEISRSAAKPAVKAA